MFYLKRPRRITPWAIFTCFLLSFAAAHLHSTRHTTRLEIERTALTGSTEEEKFSYARLLAARGEDVAAVRFAEDTQADTIDRAGLTEADLAYFDSVAERQPAPPTTTTEPETAAGPEPIVTDEATFHLAHRLARWNLNLTKSLLALAAFLLGYDYLRRFNDPNNPSFPLPLPSALPNAITPLPAFVITGPEQDDLTRELARIAQRGDTFLCLTNDSETAAAAMKSVVSAAKWRRPSGLIHIHEETPDISDEFIFEALWYGRSSFIVDHPGRIESLINTTLAAFSNRKASRARVRQSFHIVWNLNENPTLLQQRQFIHFAKATGTSFVIL
ncbi:MAG: hypothetical protein ACNA8L_04380 [Luteolibacter sp.]